MFIAMSPLFLFEPLYFC